VEGYDRGGGTGRFCYVVLPTFDREQCVDEKSESVMTAGTRTVLRILGTIHLGDRYYGQITYGNGILSIGADVGQFGRGQAAAKEIAVE
jgi:hypothetical protein